MARIPRLDLGKYRGQWVALHLRTRTVVAHDQTLIGAEQKAAKRGVRQPLMLSVPTSDAIFVGTH